MDWFVELELSTRQQQLLVDGANSHRSNNNFTQGMAATTKTNNNSSPEGNISESNSQISDVNSGATMFLSSDATEIHLLSSLE
ncbi:bacteriocin [Nostoc sp. CCY0012]|uniref:bacteriocin n=1 Tax=Nostoc sp. CCY0012 TaxID=1056123 RepID=UPI0039C6A0B3